jgi:hypothetical protein
MVTSLGNDEVCEKNGAAGRPRLRGFVESSWTLALFALCSHIVGCGSGNSTPTNWEDSRPTVDNGIESYDGLPPNPNTSWGDDHEVAKPEEEAPAEEAKAPAEESSDFADPAADPSDNEPSDEPRSSSASEPSQRRLDFLSIDERLHAIETDLDGFENPTDRERMRYIDLSNLSNAGYTDRQLEPYRQALSLLVNSLSQGDAIVKPRAVDDARLLYALDLRDYAWDANTWEDIVADYPYAVSYNQDSRVLPYDEESARVIRDDTQTNVPYIQGDWFMAHASSAPLYYDILQIPGNIAQFAAGLGVNIGQDIRDQQVVRAGFNSSGVALNNRVIERHEQPGSGGAFWLSYDFRSSVDVRNVFAHPEDFEQDGIEGLFSLPNGLSGYFIANANFVRLNKAATDLVTDPSSRDHAVQAGVSCMGGCHLARGVELKNDEVRDFVALAADDANTIEETFALYGTRDQLAALIREDTTRYQAAVFDTGFAVRDENALNQIVLTHQDTLDLAGVAGVLGVREATLSSALSASPQIFPAEILPLRDAGAAVHRETLDAVIADVVTGLGLGASIQP